MIVRRAPLRSQKMVKALHATACSAPQARPVEEQVAQSTAQADLTTTTPAPRVINVDKHAAYPKAMAELKAAGILPEQVELRQVKYLNNLIEQGHRFIKRLVKPGMGFFSIETAGRTLQGYEVMNMIRKGQMRRVGKGDINWQVAFIASLFGVAAYSQPQEEQDAHRVPQDFLQHHTRFCISCNNAIHHL